MTIYFSCTFNIGKISSSKEAYLPPKIWSRLSCKFSHLHSMTFKTTKFHQILLRSFRGVMLTNSFSRIFFFNFGKISKVQKGGNSQEKKWIIISCEYSVLYNYKVSWNSAELFQRSCADKKTGMTDLLTDWGTGQKHYIPSATCCMGYNFLPLKKAGTLYLNEFPLSKDALCQVWLKLAQWFWRKF